LKKILWKVNSILFFCSFAHCCSCDTLSWTIMSEFTCKGFTSNFSIMLNFAFHISYCKCINSAMKREEKCSRYFFFFSSFEDFLVSRKGVSFPIAKQVAWDNRRSSTCDQSTSTTLLSTGTNDIVQNDRCGRASCKAILPLYILDKTFMNIVTHAYFCVWWSNHVRKISGSSNGFSIVL